MSELQTSIEDAWVYLHRCFTRLPHELDIGWDDVTNPDNDDISWHKLKGLNLLDFAISQSLGTWGKGRGQGLDSLVCVALLHIRDCCVGEEKSQDKAKVSKVEQGNRDDTGHLHSPGQRVVHISEVHQERVSALLWQLVGAVLFQSLLVLACGETLG